MSDVNALKDQVVEKLNAAEDFRAVVAFEVTDHRQTLVIDATQRPVVTDSTANPKATFKAKADVFQGIMDGSVSPFTAIPTRKLKFEGSTGVAMHLLKAIA